MQVLKEPGREPSSQSLMWVQTGGPPDRPVILFALDAVQLVDQIQGNVCAPGFTVGLHFLRFDELAACVRPAAQSLHAVLRSQRVVTGVVVGHDIAAIAIQKTRRLATIGHRRMPDTPSIMLLSYCIIRRFAAQPADREVDTLRTGTSDLLASFHEHYADLLSFLARRLGNVELAADVAQDTYLRLVGLPAGDPIKEPRAFLFRVAGNLAIDRLRREGRLNALHTDEAAALDLCHPSASPEAALLADESLAQLDNALDRLPANVRLALLLNRVEGLTHAQIATRLGVSESMVGKYIVQAVRHCRDWVRRSESV